MRSLLAWLLKGGADAATRSEAEGLRRELKLARVEIEALRLERDSLAAVVVRDRHRVQAETQEFAARVARAGG